MQECCICLTEINKTTGQVDMSCSHKYHLKCISKWLSNHSTCPMCRAKTSEMETLESKPITYGIGGNRIYSDVQSGIASRAIIYMQDYIERYNYTWNESMTPTSYNTIESNVIIPTQIPQDTESQDTESQEINPQNEFPQVDVDLVAQQAGVGVIRALDALRTTNGDIVNAIIRLVDEV